MGPRSSHIPIGYSLQTYDFLPWLSASQQLIQLWLSLFVGSSGQQKRINQMGKTEKELGGL